MTKIIAQIMKSNFSLLSSDVWSLGCVAYELLQLYISVELGLKKEEDESEQKSVN